MSKVFDAYALYYDLLYKEKNYQKEVNYIHKILSNYDIHSGSILELGCGTGMHAVHLAQLGFFIHGIDISPAMIKIAQTKKKTVSNSQLSFEVGDIRSVQIGKNFDAVISLFHVASYQTTNEDILSMFINASKHLKSGGIFIFDFWYGPAVLSEKPSIRIKRFREKNFSVLRIAEPNMICNNNVVEVNYTVIVTSEDGQQREVLTEKHPMRYFFLPEFEMILKSAGMKVVNSNAWLSNKPLSWDSWQGVIIAQKISDNNSNVES